MHEEEDEDTLMIAIAQVASNAAVGGGIVGMEESPSIDHRTLPRATRKTYDPAGALYCINRDYLGPAPLFDGKEFDTMFRISRSRFEALMQDVGNSGDPFFLTTTDAHGRPAATLQARLLLPLKTLAYGVPPHAFRDYFSMSKTMCRECCFEFDRIIQQLHEKEYLRLPTPFDLKQIDKLHRKVHRVPGMYGSLDCMHTFWKNCPKAWQGQYKGKGKKPPSIILEGISDYNLWMWHVSYGCAGTLNDLNVLNPSPFLDALLDGSFANLEQLAETVPFEILKDDWFEQMFVTVDGIYPQYRRFVKGFSQPIDRKEIVYSDWQESTRKDIERAFGVMQGQWQWLSRPITLFQLKDIAARVRTCMILHNMNVSDRVMEGDPRKRYDPAHKITFVERYDISKPADLDEVQQANGCNRTASSIAVRNMPTHIHKHSTRREAWQDLSNTEEHYNLHNSLKHFIYALPKKD